MHKIRRSPPPWRLDTDQGSKGAIVHESRPPPWPVRNRLPRGIFTELNRGLLVPLHESIPELAEMEPSSKDNAAE